MKSSNSSYVFFPFLKSTEPIDIGGFTFRSTLGAVGLGSDEAATVKELNEMLFLRDNYRIQNATYAIIPRVDFLTSQETLRRLADIQSVVAYFYSLPRHQFGDITFSPEYASMAIFTPGKISKYLVTENHNVTEVSDSRMLSEGKWGMVDGYSGLYNFKHYFWVVNGSKLYGEKPQITLNLNQDLSADVRALAAGRSDYRLLLALLSRTRTSFSSKVFAAVDWFNSANKSGNTEAKSIVDLAIAFEALLGLPEDDKTKRLVDSISLLLGRTPRVDVWAEQFYRARSKIVHEGTINEAVFAPNPKAHREQFYQSLLSYGRQIFQLCLGTLLSGAFLAESDGLEEKFVSNRERFEEICRILDGASQNPSSEIWTKVLPIIEAVARYLYVPGSTIEIPLMLGAIKRLATLATKEPSGVSDEVLEKLRVLISTPTEQDHFGQLKVLDELMSLMSDPSKPVSFGDASPISSLVVSVWHLTVQHYNYLVQQRIDAAKSEISST